MLDVLQSLGLVMEIAPGSDGALAVWKGKKNLGPLPGGPVLLSFTAQP